MSDSAITMSGDSGSMILTDDVIIDFDLSKYGLSIKVSGIDGAIFQPLLSASFNNGFVWSMCEGDHFVKEINIELGESNE